MTMKDRVKELRRVPASELRANPKNWRRHPPAQEAALRGVLEDIGFADAVIARETPDGLELIDGHLRQEVMGDQPVPVLIVDVTEEEADKLLLTYDPLAMMAHADTDQLLQLLRDTQFADKAVNDMLEAVANGERLPMPDLHEPVEDPGPQIDRAEELREKWQTERGQVWEVGRHRLMCGDVTGELDIGTLIAGGAVRMIWTDPPYGVDYGNHRNAKWGKHSPIANDALPPTELARFWKTAFTNLCQYVTGDLYVAAPPGPLLRLLDITLEETPWERHQWLVWVKDRLVLGRSNYHYRHEQLWYGWLKKGKSSWSVGRDRDSVMEVPRPSRSDEHPTMKPVELVGQMIGNSSSRNDAVLDPFLGSGTTMVAAEQLGRICYGMEIEPKYVAVTLERMAGMGLEPKLVTG
jgi:DNA modification methylase